MTQEKIKVCFIMPKAYPLFNPQVNGVFGGAEVDLYYLSTELAKDQRFQVSFVVADYGQQSEESFENVCVIKSLNFKQNPLTSAFKIWKALKKADADIYMMKTPSLGVPLVQAFCRLKKRIFTYRVASERECNGVYKSGHFFIGSIFHCCLRKASAVFVQNEKDKENMQKTVGAVPDVIANGHRQPEQQSVSKDSVIWVGRTEPIKGPGRFPDLAAKFPDQHFIMICQRATGDDHYDAFVRRARSVPNLEFHERVDFHDIGAYFSRARVLVNTSDSEGFPNTFIQACAHAAAILSLKVNPDNFLTDYACGLSCGGDQDKLVRGLKFLLENERYLELGKNGRTYVEQKHDISQIIKHYKAIFHKLIAKQGSSS